MPGSSPQTDTAAPDPAAPPDGGPFQDDRPPRSLRDMLAAVLDGESLGAMLARGAAGSVIANFVGSGAAFLVQLALARLLGADRFSLYIYALAWMNVAKLAGLLEYQIATVRFVGQYNGAGDWTLLRGYLRWAQGFVILASTAVGVAGAGRLLLGSGALDSDHLSAYLAACALLPFWNLLIVKAATLQGYKRITESQTSLLVVRPVVLGCIAGAAALLVGRPLTAADALYFNLAATVVALVVAWRLVRRARPPEVESVAPEYRPRLWFTTSLGLVWFSAANLVLSQEIDVVVVGSLMGVAEAGLYGVASQLAAILGLGASAVIAVSLPWFSDLHARGETRQLQMVTRMSMAGTLVVSTAGFVGLILLGRVFLGWFGTEFQAAYGILAILATGQFIGASVGNVSGFLMTLTGNHNRAGAIVVTAAVLNLALMFILIPRLGGRGAAYATVIASVLRSGAMALAARRYVGVNIFALRRPDGAA